MAGPAVEAGENPTGKMTREGEDGRIDHAHAERGRITIFDRLVFVENRKIRFFQPFRLSGP